MLSAKSWKPDAVMRLLLSVFICFLAGSLVVYGMHYAGAGAKAGPSVFVLIGAALVCLSATLAGLRKSWDPEDLTSRAAVRMIGFYAVLLTCFFAGVFLGGVAQMRSGPLSLAAPSTGQLVVTTLSFQGAALGFIWLLLREHRLRWSEAFGLSNNWPHAVLLGLMLACAFLPIGWGLQWLSGQVMTHIPLWPFKPEEQLSVQTLRSAASWGQRLALGVVTIALAPVAEELLFRGILYTWIKQAGFKRLALWGTGFLFALMHSNAASFVPLFALAVALALLYEWTDNLLAPIAAHALFNALNFSVLFWVNKPPQ